MSFDEEMYANGEDSIDSSPEDSLEEGEDFLTPPTKRRRISPRRNRNNQESSYPPPSRIKNTHSTITELRDVLSMKPSPSTPSTLTTSTFESLNVAPWLVHSLQSLAIMKPTEIQRSCIPEILRGRDCIGGSKTGTGKTIAFAVPILQKWAEDPYGTYAVVMTPTRELALQIYEQFLALGAPQSLKVVLVTGGTDMRPQALALAQRPHIVVATPGRLADHVQTSGKETTIGLKRAKVVVLDEADRLLASGPGSMLPDLNTCLSALPPSSARLTLLFTATVTPEVRALKSRPRPADRPPIFVSEINDPSLSSLDSQTPLPTTLKQTYVQAPLAQKDAYLHVLLQTNSLNPKSNPPSIIIFTNRTSTADILHRTLLALNHNVTSLHSQLPQSQRNRNLSSFRALKTRILIATDVASRGLDVPEVAVVINYDVPRNPADYVHRVGRTARAGRPGTSITFVSQRDVHLVLAIEAYTSNAAQTTDSMSDGTHPSTNHDDSTSSNKTFRNNTANPSENETEKTQTEIETETETEASPATGKMTLWHEDSVNLETRVVKGRVLKDVLEARMEAAREIEGGRDVNGWRRGVIRKDRKRWKEGE